ncbi:hypothetical protein BJ878DRAFT_543847 [Calycina marina]|uniref:Uncharacterized protein n=1 Tax=Calycina marina TaxID=1763456 RepID=A0A9P7Z066_9HELO|nr:hypothetical protein BJ878DRAFT_543847 [Calycina marina]
MASERRYRGAANAIRAGTSTHPELDQALLTAGGDQGPGTIQETVRAEVQKPRMKWVYCSDHTDPVNFGFMFLVPDDGADEVEPLEIPSSLPSTDRAPSTTVPDATSLYPRHSQTATPNFTSSVSSASIPAFQIDGSHYYEIEQSRSVSPQVTQQINPHATFITSPHQVYDGSSITYQDAFNSTYQDAFNFTSRGPHSISSYVEPNLQQLPYRQSTPPETSDASSPFQTPTSNAPWTMQTGSQFQEHEYFSENWDATFNQTLASALYSVPTTSGASVELIHAPSLAQKRKHSRSPSHTDALLQEPLQGGHPANREAHKRRHALEDLMPIPNYDRIPTICSRCHIYQVANFTPEQTEYLLNRPHQSKNPSICNLCLQAFAHMEDSLLSGPAFIERSRSWRGFMLERPHIQYDFEALNQPSDQWVTTVKQARSTLLWGEDCTELLEIVRNYQNNFNKPNLSLQATAISLSAVCDLYNCFVTAPTRPSHCAVQDIVAHVRTVRITLRAAFQHLQHLALSPTPTRERKDWFPTFLSAVMITMAAITFVDILGSAQPPYREQIWGNDWGERVKEMRHGGYGMLIGVLRANTNGVNPLKLKCWTEEKSDPFIIETPKSYKKGKQSLRETSSPAEREREILLGRQSPAALRGVLELKKWQEKYKADLEIGENMFVKEIYAQAMMRPVASLWKVFEMKDTAGL